MAFFAYYPAQIYLGKYDTDQTVLVFLGGIAWCGILYFLAKLVFRLGLKRNESVGL
ncbi:MAG: ABC-2 family transporter protein [Flammeovirgaceae bacterium]